MNVMQPEYQWFIARDGKQHGPISGVEMTKLVELGHLRPIDLVWRQGFDEWRPASTVFTPPSGPAPLASQPLSAAPQTPRQAEADAPFGTARNRTAAPAADTGRSPVNTQPAPRSVQGHMTTLDPSPARTAGLRTFAVASLLLLVIGAGGGLAYVYRDTLSALTRSKAPSSEKPASTSQAASQPAAAIASAADSGPIAGLDGPAAALDAVYRKSAHWSVIRREFPDWYAERLKEASKLSGESKSETDVTRYLVGEVVKLRRQNMEQALSAPVERLKSMASAFLTNLEGLEKVSPLVCYAFIAKGENTPLVAERLQSVDSGFQEKAQVAAIFEAIADGRRSPVKHASAQKPDYDLLASQLSKSGWTAFELQLFANPKALAAAAPEQVCKMVQDWFRAHLALTDAQVQERLLFETLKPVVGG